MRSTVDRCSSSVLRGSWDPLDPPSPGRLGLLPHVELSVPDCGQSSAPQANTARSASAVNAVERRGLPLEPSLDGRTQADLVDVVQAAVRDVTWAAVPQLRDQEPGAVAIEPNDGGRLVLSVSDPSARRTFTTTRSSLVSSRAPTMPTITTAQVAAAWTSSTTTAGVAITGPREDESVAMRSRRREGRVADAPS